jgi:hypothetical protein
LFLEKGSKMKCFRPKIIIDEKQKMGIDPFFEIYPHYFFKLYYIVKNVLYLILTSNREPFPKKFNYLILLTNSLIVKPDLTISDRNVPLATSR